MSARSCAICLLCALALQACATLRPAPPPDPAAVVVHIYTAHLDTPTTRRPVGTGFVVREGGLIATAAHVVNQDDLVEIRLPATPSTPERYVPAWRVAADPERDIALLKIDPPTPKHLRPVHLNTNPLPLGAPVAIYGFPDAELVGLQLRRSSGTISAMRDNPLVPLDRVTPMIELEASIEPGNSGSPVFNPDNDVVGLVSSRWKNTDAYGLASPSAALLDLLKSAWPHAEAAAVLDLQRRLTIAAPQVEHALQLARAMRNIFPPGEEADLRAQQLEACMDLAQRRLTTAAEQLHPHRLIAAASHALRLVEHELHTHQQELDMLQAARDALQAPRPHTP
jgi:S1-C subfamily serine protease